MGENLSKVRSNAEKYKVSDLYLLTIKRKVVYVTGVSTLYITEFLLGVLKKGKYHELFSDLELSKMEGDNPPSFDIPFVSKAEPLSESVNKTILNKQELFEIILNINTFRRSAWDVDDE